MKKLLITGAGGFLGSHLVEIASASYEVYGFSLDSKINLPPNNCYYFPLSDKSKLQELLEEIQPDYLIQCAAISSEAGCFNQPELAYTVNVSTVKWLQDWCVQHHKRMIFTSTDLVFSGEDAPYSEWDKAEPRLKYGQLKRAAEMQLLDISNISIVRLPLLIGIGLGDKKGLLADFISKCHQNEVQFLFTDEFRNPASVNDVAKFLIQFLNLSHNGILHLGGLERWSRYDLALQFCKFLNLSEENILPTTRAEKKMSNRPFDTNMISEKAYQLGFQPQKVADALQYLKLDLKTKAQ
jgi:dTDP-4-dehydrorhamnose reductase